MVRFLPKLGNIKIGKVSKGAPKILSGIRVTTTDKKGEENFRIHPLFQEEIQEHGDLKQLEVILPLGDKSFEVGKISFVRVAGKHRFMAKLIGHKVYLISLDPFRDQNGNVFTLVTEYCSTEDAERLNRLDMKTRGILYALPIKALKTGIVGVFHFKTESLNSIMEIKNSIEAAKAMHGNLFISVPFVMEVHTKLTNFKEGKEISYARIVPTVKDKIIEKTLAEKFFKITNEMEKARALEIANAIPFEKAVREYFDGNGSVEPDNGDFEGDNVFSPLQNQASAKREKTIAIGKKEENETEDVGFQEKQEKPAEQKPEDLIEVPVIAAAPAKTASEPEAKKEREEEHVERKESVKSEAEQKGGNKSEETEKEKEQAKSEEKPKRKRGRPRKSESKEKEISTPPLISEENMPKQEQTETKEEPKQPAAAKTKTMDEETKEGIKQLSEKHKIPLRVLTDYFELAGLGSVEDLEKEIEELAKSNNVATYQVSTKFITKLMELKRKRASAG